MFGEQAICAEEQCCESPARDLDRLSAIAASAERAALEIQRFIDRYNGAPTTPSSNAERAAPPSGHTGRIRQIAKTIEKIEQLSATLSSIG